jgi:simple sugar transport system permease protein
VTGVFQGLLLFALLGCDTLIQYRVRFTPSRAPRAVTVAHPVASATAPEPPQ